MEFKKHGDDYGGKHIQRYHQEDQENIKGLIPVPSASNKVSIVFIEKVIEGVDHCDSCVVACEEHIEKEEEEVFSVPEANTVVDPGTVVVHV